MDTTPAVTVDYSAFNTAFTSVATAFAPEIIAISAIGLGVFALVWGIPQLKKVFKKAAS